VWGDGNQVVGHLTLGQPAQDRIVARRMVSTDDFDGLRSAGIAGLITGSIDLADIESLSPGFAVVITEGFGKEPIKADLWELLEKHDGALVALDPTTHLRAGVIRPRIILPTDCR
jgi:hypothetical protein